MARRLALLLCVALLGCRGSPSSGWDRALEKWRAREPGAWAAWRAAADRGSDEASHRLAEAEVLYQDGVERLEQGRPDAGERLRRGAEIAPIAPPLYLRLARACRTQGAWVRAADFYRKFLAEAPEPRARAEAEAELSQLAGEMGDPFSQRQNDAIARRAIAAISVVALLALVVAALLLRRGGRLRVDDILAEHPERATAFVYLANVLRHELIKHRLAPLRGGDSTHAGSLDPIVVAWHRHLDAIAAALGLPRARLLREPSFRSADHAIVAIGRAEAVRKEVPAEALRALAAFDRRLVDCARRIERTSLDRALLTRLVESLRDERPGRRLEVEVELGEADGTIAALMLSSDLLLVLRNVARNAIAAAAKQGAPAIRIDTRVHLDETGQEWARVVVEDPSPARLPSNSPPDRGLGLVRATLARYGGALCELTPSPGWQKALAISLPRAEPDEDPVAVRVAA
jgi:hypothetical protein